MAGVLNYDNYINIFATAEDVKQTFPRDQYTLTYDFDDLGADGWTAEFSWMNLVIDQIKYTVDGTPDFSKSSCIGFFEVDQGSGSQYDSTTISLPANMYTGPILPGAERNVPVTIVNILWTKGTANFQRQLLLIQNWEPGTEILDPTLDPDYIPIIESHPVIVTFTLSTTTAFVGTTISVSSVATSTHIGSIVNDYDIKLTPPFFSQFGNNPVISSSKFVDGLGLTEFDLTRQFVDQTITTTTNYTIVSSSTVATTGTVFGRTVNTSSVFTLSADVYRDHQVRLQWYYDRETGFRGGRTGSQTLRVNTSQDYVYVGQALELTLTQNPQFQRTGNTSTFVISHNITSSTAITGLITLYADYTPFGESESSVITVGTGTFNVAGDLTIATVLNSGTYALQAYYAGNMGLDIFHPMYLNTWTNVQSHYVQFGRDFSLTEMLIEENANNDILYVHAIDDGNYENTITGSVTFFKNDIAIGTSTFERYTYFLPDTYERPKFKIPCPIPYPYADLRTSNLTNAPGKNLGLSYSDYPVGNMMMWDYSDYNWDKAAAPSYLATLKYNSKQLDWPPTLTPINTIALKNTDNELIPAQVPFTMTLPVPNDTFTGNPDDFSATITANEYLGTATYVYPNVTFTSKRDYRGLTQYTAVDELYYHPDATSSTVYISTAPAGPCGTTRGRYSQNIIEPRGTARPVGTRYHWTYGSYIDYSVPPTISEDGSTYIFTRVNYIIDLGDERPHEFTVAGTSTGITHVYKFGITNYSNLVVNGRNTFQVITYQSDVLAPSSAVYDQPGWEARVGAKYWNNYSRLPQIYLGGAPIDNLPGGQSRRHYFEKFYQGVTQTYLLSQSAGSDIIDLATNGVVPGAYKGRQYELPTGVIETDIKSRSHLAKLILSKNIIDTTSTYRAEFTGDVAAPDVGFYPMDNISFYDHSDTKVEFTDGGEIRTRYNPYVTSPRPSVNSGWWAEGSEPLQNNVNFGKVSNDSRIRFPNAKVETLSTFTTIQNILLPDRYVGVQDGIPQDYQRKLGWLSRRTPKNFVEITHDDITLKSKTLEYSTATNILTRTVNGNIQQIPLYINLPPILRPETYPVKSETFGNSIFDTTRLGLLNTATFTTSSMATIVYPIAAEFTGTVVLSSTSTSIVPKDPNSYDPAYPERGGYIPTWGINVDIPSDYKITPGKVIKKVTSTATTWPATINDTEILFHSGVYSLTSGTMTMAADSTIVLPASENWFYRGDPGRFTNYPPNSASDQYYTANGTWYWWWRVEQWTSSGTTLIKSSIFAPGLPVDYSPPWNQSGLVGEENIKVVTPYPETYLQKIGQPYSDRILPNFTIASSTDTTPYLFKIYFVLTQKTTTTNSNVNLWQPTATFKETAEVDHSVNKMLLKTGGGSILYSFNN